MVPSWLRTSPGVHSEIALSLPAPGGPGLAACFPYLRRFGMRILLAGALALVVLAGSVRADEQPKQAPKVVLRSPDGKKTYDLEKLTADGPVLVRLTCACSGCDLELPFFQKLQAAYDAKGLKTLAVFKEKPEDASNYIVKKDIRFLWLEDPKGDLWKTFDAKAMPTNILIDKG